ncbi:MAG: Stp1/IreP family PP2C-type Ser/Thr phosphatase [Chloroflexota bacterium]
MPEHLRILVCSNPACGAIFPPREGDPERFCTDCGKALGVGGQSLLLVETLTPVAESVKRVVAQGLSHGNVRAPLAVFDETVAGVQRHCLVMPEVSTVGGHPETRQALRWGVELARGLDYLHANGIAFNGGLDETCFALVEDRAVWANFAGCVLYPDSYVADDVRRMHAADTRALAAIIFYWLTGKRQYEHDPNLLPAIDKVFEQALGASGFASGEELMQALEQAVENAVASQVVDFRLGRRTDVGMVRSLNEDSILTLEIGRVLQSISQPLGVYVVADGMGGHAAGEIASGAIVNTIAQKAVMELMPTQIAQGVGQDRSEWLRQAVEAANKQVFELRKSAGTDMGSTLVSAVLEGSKAFVAHVGDSRVYMVNAQGIRQLTTDHSLVERLIATNQITREEARHHPQRNVIYRTIGDKSKVDVDISVQTLSPGDHLLLCSDGLCGMVEDETIRRIVMHADSPQSACDGLIDAANAAGGDDNISVIIIKLVQV